MHFLSKRLIIRWCIWGTIVLVWFWLGWICWIFLLSSIESLLLILNINQLSYWLVVTFSFQRELPIQRTALSSHNLPTSVRTIAFTAIFAKFFRGLICINSWTLSTAMASTRDRWASFIYSIERMQVWHCRLQSEHLATWCFHSSLIF